MNKINTTSKSTPLRHHGAPIHQKFLLYGVLIILMSLVLPSVAGSEFQQPGPASFAIKQLFDKHSAKIESRPLITLEDKENESLETCSVMMKITDLEKILMFSVSAWLVFWISRLSFALEQKPASGLKNDSVSLRVLWTVTGYVRGPNALLDDEQARSLIFSPLDMTEDSISFAGQVCKPITFSRKTVRLSDYLSVTHGIAPQDLNLENQTVQVIQTTCDIPGFSEFLRLEDRRLLVSINGVFYFLEPFIIY